MTIVYHIGLAEYISCVFYGYYRVCSMSMGLLWESAIC